MRKIIPFVLVALSGCVTIGCAGKQKVTRHATIKTTCYEYADGKVLCDKVRLLLTRDGWERWKILGVKMHEAPVHERLERKRK